MFYAIMKSGGGEMRILLVEDEKRMSQALCQILRLSREHNKAKLSVINAGEVIPLQERSRIFEKFYRMDATRNGEDKHYGLGLAIAKSAVTAHKGQIEVFCHDGLIEFRVILPIS